MTKSLLALSLALLTLFSCNSGTDEDSSTTEKVEETVENVQETAKNVTTAISTNIEDFSDYSIEKIDYAIESETKAAAEVQTIIAQLEKDMEFAPDEAKKEYQTKIDTYKNRAKYYAERLESLMQAKKERSGE